jgi:hypothetical protein
MASVSIRAETLRPPQARRASEDGLTSFGAAVQQLPGQNTAVGRAWLKQLQTDLDPIRGKGFSVLPASQWLTPHVGHSLFNSIGGPAELDIKGQRIPRGGLSQGGAVRHLSEKQLEPFDNFSAWLQQLMTVSLSSGEKPHVRLSTIRTNSREAGAGLNFRQLHVDGGQFAAMVTLKGKGTLYVPDAPKLSLRSGNDDWKAVRERRDGARQLGLGEVLIISCDERGNRYDAVRPTVHASPMDDGDRLFYLVRL